MVVCSFAQAAATAPKVTSTSSKKMAVPRIAQLVDSEGKMYDIYSPEELYPAPLLAKDFDYEEAIEMLATAGRGHYRLYQGEESFRELPCPIIPWTNDTKLRKPVGGKVAKLEVRIDPLWLLYSMNLLWDDIVEILVQHGVCMDLRQILFNTSITTYSNNNTFVLYGKDSIGLGRCLDKMFRCLAQVIIINNHNAPLDTPGLHTSSGFMLHERDFGNDFLPERVRIIQPQDSRDLLCGKKDGKINRIQRECDCRITVRDGEQDRKYFWIFLEPNCITTSNNNMTEAMESMKRELPAELCFHLDDQFHKSLIGVGGSNIQRVMKQHGVYVRFLGSGESAHVLGSDEREWPGAPLANVLIRTPQRNQPALAAMKADLFGIVGKALPVLRTFPLSDSYPTNNSTNNSDYGWIIRKGNSLVRLQRIINNNNSENTKKDELEMEELIKEIPDDISLLSGAEDLRASPLPEPNSNYSYLPMEWIQHDPLYLIRLRSNSLSSAPSTNNTSNNNNTLGVIGQERRRSSI